MLARLLKGSRRPSGGAGVAAQLAARVASGDGALTEDDNTPGAAAALASAGFYAEALARVDTALASSTGDVRWVFARGWTLFEWGRFREARSWLEKAAGMGLEDSHLFLRIGWSRLWTIGGQSAEEWMRKAAEYAPDDWLGYFGLGSSLRSQGKIDEAIICFEDALERSPNNAQCLSSLFECHYAQDRWPLAEDFARRAAEIDGRNPKAWTNLGVALIAQDRVGEATEAFERSESLTGGEADPHLNLGICLHDAGRLREAFQLYERELPKRLSTRAYAHYGHALLTAGRFREGWMHYESRWAQDPLLSLRPPYRKPLWAGQDLHGKTILLRSEQGVGDVIQFIRYAPHVKALGPTVLLQLRRNIRELAASFPGVDRILDPGEAVPEFDFYIHLMSLPRVFGTELGTIPAEVPYLKPEPARVDYWADRVRDDGSLRVGIVWAGDPGHLRDRQRSIGLQRLAPLWEVRGVRFFSLQKGPQADEIKTVLADVEIVDLGSSLRDFADTAAVINQLDLVICVDTSVAHLAGAIGKSVWVLLPTPSDWRWLEDREDTPWYPTMRLFRQTRQGDWDDVIARVKELLWRHVTEHAFGSRIHTSSSQASSRRFLTLESDELSQLPMPGFCCIAETSVGIVQYWPDQHPIGRSIERYGEYLQQELNMFARWISPGSTVIEVGAGIGLHALFLASRLGDAGHLILYEGDALRRRVLQQNLSANRVANVTLMKRRLFQGMLPDVQSDRRTPIHSHTPSDLETIDQLGLETLQWIKVSDPAVVKIVMEGAADTLWRHRPTLWCAAGDDDSLRELSIWVKDFAYRSFEVRTSLFNPENFNRRTVDVFEGKSAYALLAVPEETDISVPIEHCVEL